LHIIKIALIVFVNTILLVKIVEAYQGRSTAPPPPPATHSTQDINAINNTLQPQPDTSTTATYNPSQAQAQDIEERNDASAIATSAFEAFANDEVDNNSRFYNPQTLRRRLNRHVEEPEGAI
jgi:hypothetical protein